MHTDPSPARGLALLLGLLCGAAGLVATIAGSYLAGVTLFLLPALAWASFNLGRAWERLELQRAAAARRTPQIVTKNAAARLGARLDA